MAEISQFAHARRSPPSCPSDTSQDARTAATCEQNSKHCHIPNKIHATLLVEMDTNVGVVHCTVRNDKLLLYLQ